LGRRKNRGYIFIKVKIILILPAHNEQDNIGLVLEDASKRLDNMEHAFVVVDDGSTDRTKEVVVSYSDRMPIHIVEHKSCKGIRFAFMSGFQRACEISENDDDIIVMLEADNTLDLRILKEMVEKMEKGYDVVSASRFMPGGKYVAFPFKRLVLSVGSNFLLRCVFRIPGLSDYTIFFRAYKAAIIKNAIKIYGHDLIKCGGFTGNAELLVKLNQINPLKVGEAPLIYRYDNKMGKSKMNIYQTTKEYLLLIVKMAKNRNP